MSSDSETILPPTAQPVAKLSAWFERNRDGLRDRWFELLRFPTVSSEPSHDSDCRKCAAWLCDEMESIGFRSAVQSTPGQPLVLAERPADLADAPTLLFYGHYDVQPADPAALWEQPDPFEPVVRGDRVHARGAQDDKGQFFFVLQALRALVAEGVPLPCVKVALEGEEEHGSAGMAAFLKQDPAWFAADILAVCDTGMASDGRPAVVAGLRGIALLNVTMEGACHDLHSGQHGGLAPNAALALARVLATLHDGEGRIAVQGFLDGLEDPTDAEQSAAAQVLFDAASYTAETGAQPVGGERGLPPHIRLGFRPTIEVNGLHGGYGGSGFKTIIPARAEAKLSARLCPGQDPERCLDAIERHLLRHAPDGLRLRIGRKEGALPGFRLPLHSPVMEQAVSILGRMDPRGAALLWEGASIPIISSLRAVSGAQPLLVGFGCEADRIHAPNESYSWTQARMCFLFYGQWIATLGRPAASSLRRK